MSQHCDFHQLLVRHQVRPTPLRLGVLEILGSTGRALSAPEIQELIRSRYRINKVTIYRILNDFNQRGIIRKLHLEGKSDYYELACEHHPPHPHFQCHYCGRVQCLEPMSLDKVWAELKGPIGNQADRLEIRVEGICQKCRKINQRRK